MRRRRALIRRQRPTAAAAAVPPRALPHATLANVDGRRALVIDGAVQSVDVPAEADEPDGYWPALLPAEPPARALLLGFGGGTVARLLWRRFGARAPLAIVGVDDDRGVIALARAAFDLELPGLTLVLADATAYLSECSGRDRPNRADPAGRDGPFDLIVVDLFRDGGVPDYVVGPRFLALLAAALVPGGLVTFNLDRGQRHAARLRRLARRFVVVRTVAIGLNLVVHARPHVPRRYRLR